MRNHCMSIVGILLEGNMNNACLFGAARCIEGVVLFPNSIDSDCSSWAIKSCPRFVVG